MTRHCSKCFSRMDSVSPHCDSFSKLPLLYEWGIKTQRLEKLALGYRASVVYRQEAATITFVPHFPSPSTGRSGWLPGCMSYRRIQCLGVRFSSNRWGTWGINKRRKLAYCPWELTKNTVTGSSALVLFQFLCHTWTCFPPKKSYLRVRYACRVWVTLAVPNVYCWLAGWMGGCVDG